jgi:hypothetical protein
MGQPAVVTGKVGYGELGQDENLVFLYRLLFFFSKATKEVFNVHDAWPLSKHITHNGPRIITRQLPRLCFPLAIHEKWHPRI